jgi:ParB family chromosome partitioning protein
MDDAPSAGLSAALVEDLTAHRTAALQAMLVDNPKVALVAIVHAQALDCQTKSRRRMHEQWI